MSKQLNAIVTKYNVQQDRKIKRACAPLKNFLQISAFTYYRTYEDSSFMTLSNQPEWIEYYYSEKLFLDNPYLVHPSLLRPGCTSISSTHNDAFKKNEANCYSKYNVYDAFLIVQKSDTFVEGFFFANNQKNVNFIDFYSNTELLKHFGKYFIQETQPIIHSMLEEGINLCKEKGPTFLTRDPNELLSNRNPLFQNFLKEIDPLSKRERQCLEMFKQGHSAQATGALLGISQRTVEHYFEKIKEKLNCNSKRELLNK